MWRGYHGNVYFEPISVSKVSTTPTPSSGASSRKTPNNNTLRRAKTDLSSLNIRQMAVLDRSLVQRQSNPFLQEDLTWLNGQQSTGSLRTHTTLGFDKPRIPYNKEKIVKGTVAGLKDKLRRTTTLTPLSASVSVNGGRSFSPSKAPPFIQSQTQYSNSEKRRMFPDIAAGSADFGVMTLQNPDTNAMVHIVPTRNHAGNVTTTAGGPGGPPRAPLSTPLGTPH